MVPSTLAGRDEPCAVFSGDSDLLGALRHDCGCVDVGVERKTLFEQECRVKQEFPCVDVSENAKFSSVLAAVFRPQLLGVERTTYSSMRQMLRFGCDHDL